MHIIAALNYYYLTVRTFMVYAHFTVTLFSFAKTDCCGILVLIVGDINIMFSTRRIAQTTLIAGSRMYCSNNSGSYLPKYAERPYTPTQFLAMSMDYIKKQDNSLDLQHLLHGIQLMHSSITPFSYDLYQWTCGRLIQNQQKLRKDEILLMLRMGLEYKIRIEPFLEHMENELHLRIHRDYHEYLEEYDQKIQGELKAMYAQLQAKSKDYFNILKETGEINEQQQHTPFQDEVQDKEQEIDKEQQGQLKQHQKWVVQMSQRLTKKSKGQKEILFDDLLEISELLRQNGSKNLGFVQYLLELLTVKFEQVESVSAPNMLQYIKFITFACQTLMEEYHANKRLYTARSIKRIFKYQTFYYQQHQLQLEQNAERMTNEQLEELVDVYSLFPIKRREIRRKIGGVICGEIKKRGIVDRQSVVLKLIDINRKDEKMKRTYRDLLGIPQPYIQQNPAKQIPPSESDAVESPAKQEQSQST